MVYKNNRIELINDVCVPGEGGISTKVDTLCKKKVICMKNYRQRARGSLKTPKKCRRHFMNAPL